mgnify:FL=1
MPQSGYPTTGDGGVFLARGTMSLPRKVESSRLKGLCSVHFWVPAQAENPAQSVVATAHMFWSPAFAGMTYIGQVMTGKPEAIRFWKARFAGLADWRACGRMPSFPCVSNASGTACGQARLGSGILPWAIAALLFACSCAVALESGEVIPAGTADGRGPLATHAVSSEPLGVAHVFGGAEPDLFVGTGRHGRRQGLFLYRWSGRDERGVPVFKLAGEAGHPVDAEHPPREIGRASCRERACHRG